MEQKNHFLTEIFYQSSKEIRQFTIEAYFAGLDFRGVYKLC
jgi:hypothetical protein